MRDLRAIVGKIAGVQSKELDLRDQDRPVEDIFEAFSTQENAFLLLSGGDGDCSRYSFIASDPFLVVRSWGRRVVVSNRVTALELIANPFDVLDTVWEYLEVSATPFGDLNGPFAGGAIGYFGYDLRYHLESLPDVAAHDVDVPDLYLIFPSIILVHDREEKTGCIVAIEHRLGDDSPPHASSGIRRFEETMRKTQPRSSQFAARAGGFMSNMTHAEYVSAVRRVREYIRQGDIYQVNLSQRFTCQFDGPHYALFRALFDTNPAPFYAYLNCGNFCVLSTSPERFIWRNDSYIETRPIKGTRPRGKTPDQDERMKKELMESLKEDAELSMIVDLLRNDLGKVCIPGTIQVAEHKRIEAYRNVFHLVSVVTGKLPPACTHTEVLKAVFPGGSITGCPKIRAMEIIEELEPVKRGVYTGAIGYLGFDRSMNLSIAIRTAVLKNHRAYLSVGGGIVYGSDPEAEYQETLDKGQTFFDLLRSLQGTGSDVP